MDSVDLFFYSWGARLSEAAVCALEILTTIPAEYSSKAWEIYRRYKDARDELDRLNRARNSYVS